MLIRRSKSVVIKKSEPKDIESTKARTIEGSKIERKIKQGDTVR